MELSPGAALAQREGCQLSQGGTERSQGEPLLHFLNVFLVFVLLNTCSYVHCFFLEKKNFPFLFAPMFEDVYFANFQVLF